MYYTHASSVKLEPLSHHTTSVLLIWIVSPLWSSTTVSSGSAPYLFRDYSFHILFSLWSNPKWHHQHNSPSGPPDETIRLIAKSLISVIIQAAIWITRNTILTRAQRVSHESNMRAWWSTSADNPPGQKAALFSNVSVSSNYRNRDCR